MTHSTMATQTRSDSLALLSTAPRARRPTNALRNVLATNSPSSNPAASLQLNRATAVALTDTSPLTRSLWPLPAQQHDVSRKSFEHYCFRVERRAAVAAPTSLLAERVAPNSQGLPVRLEIAPKHSGGTGGHTRVTFERLQRVSHHWLVMGSTPSVPAETLQHPEG